MSGQTGSAVIGTGADMVARMRAVLPSSWFPITPPGAATSEAPVLDALLSGIGWTWSWFYDLISYASHQARIATATDGFLDMICADFFGGAVKRQINEADDAFRSRIYANLLLPRATRSALSEAVAALTGRTPFVFEPTRADDTGGYGATSSTGAGGGRGLGSPGLGYGSAIMPFQYMLTVLATGSWSSRGSNASYIDNDGAMRIAGPHIVRPLYIGGVLQGSLVEGRGFNLIKDSVGWSNCMPASPGGPCQWILDPSGDDGIWSGQPLLRVSITKGGSISGPMVTVGPGVGAVTGSIWIMLPSGQNFARLSLEIFDRADVGDAVVQPIDLTIVNQWQRLVVSLPSYGLTGRQVSMTLVGVSADAVALDLLTQCWQIEPGLVATSYIPSQTEIGVRQADDLQLLDTLPSSTIDLVGLEQAIGRAIPAASVPWMTVIGEAA